MRVKILFQRDIAYIACFICFMDTISLKFLIIADFLDSGHSLRSARWRGRVHCRSRKGVSILAGDGATDVRLLSQVGDQGVVEGGVEVKKTADVAGAGFPLLPLRVLQVSLSP